MTFAERGDDSRIRFDPTQQFGRQDLWRCAVCGTKMVYQIDTDELSWQKV